VPTTAPPIGSMTIVNGGAQSGRAEQGDQIVISFFPAPPLGNLCSAWNGASYPDLTGPNVKLGMDQSGAGDSEVSGITDTSDCASGFHFGTIDLGQSGYAVGSTTFGGGAGGQCTGSVSTGCTRVHWDGHNTLTITLGRENKSLPVQAAPSIAVFSPDPALGPVGTISTANEEHF